VSEAVDAWLLDGDPSVAWQVERDLLGAPDARWAKTRARVATEGWGARLLALREPDGRWTRARGPGGWRGLYTPKWTSTFYTLRVLAWLGLDETHPEAVESCALLLDRGVRDDGGAQLWSTDVSDTCVTAMLVSLAARFGHARDERVPWMLAHLLEEQLDDGGWNCERYRGARHSSFHTTLSALECFADVAEATPASLHWFREAADRGREFFLAHRLFKSHSTGAVVDERFTRFSFPPRWFFDVLRGLEHFARVDAPWDERLADAVAVLEARRRADGRWNTQNRHAGEEHFALEPAGRPGRMNTLRARRVLAWLDRVR
jgi:hypothetical protein